MKKLIPLSKQSLGLNMAFLLAMILNSFMVFANNCDEIEGFEFTNGYESVALEDGGTYDINSLPDNFYVNLILDDDDGESVRFEVEGGEWDVHETIIENYEPYTFPAGNSSWDVGLGTFEIEATLYPYNHGWGYACDSETITFTLTDEISCEANAGTLMASEMTVCLDGETMISATANGDSNVPDGYSTVYVLTQGEGLVIVGAGGEPSFMVSEGGNYTIHTLVYDPNTLDLGIVVPGETTGFDVNGLLIQGGGMICASLDVAGAPVTVEAPNAGTLTAVESTVTLNGETMISATANGDSNVPDGYSTVYVLTQGDGLVIIGAGGEPSFTVTEAGNYTIHSLVYDPNTLDLGIVVPGETTGFDVYGLIVPGGGSICASLDVAGAPVEVVACEADAGTLMASEMTVCLDGETMISAAANGDSNVPDGYSTVYVLTQGEGLVIVGAGGEPSFMVSEGGNYTIHTLVYDPNTLDLGIVVPGETTGFDVNGLLIQGGGMICASLDVAGAPVTVEAPNAGTLTAVESTVTLNGETMISATANGDSNVPDGYSTVYVLTQGDGLVIIGAGGEPSFTVTEAGNYTIHSLVYDPNTLDLGIVVPGETTGFDVYGLIVPGGGSICASLDVAGAPVEVVACEADAGTLMANEMTVCLDGETMISATANGDSNVPDGYSTVYVLTQGEGLVIVGAGGEPSFMVSEGGNYTIHTLVYDPNTLDLGIVVPGETTGFDVNGLLIQGGGMICASLDVAGAPVTVEAPNAGTLTAVESTVTLNGETMISATANGDSNVPVGYSTVYVLTQGDGLVIIGAGGEPSFTVTEAGNYTIHSLVYDPNTLDLGIVVPGETTGFDVYGLIVPGGGSICASLDVAGAPIEVVENEICTANAGTLYSPNPIQCIQNGEATIFANINSAPVVPEGYEVLYVLTNAFDLTILNVNAEPEFTVNSSGFYRIHTLVYDPNTLDLSIVVPGETTGFDVNGLLIQGGGDICASLDVQGAVSLVLQGWICNWFFNYFGGRDADTQVDDWARQFDSYEAFEKSIAPNFNVLDIFPNPTADIVNIQVELFDNEQLQLQVLDATGKRVAMTINPIVHSGTYNLNFGALESGIYMIQFNSEYRTGVQKIQVMR